MADPSRPGDGGGDRVLVATLNMRNIADRWPERIHLLLADITWPLIVVGDFNAEPVESTYAQMVEAGFRSSHAEANGAEPAVTWPSGIRAQGMDVDGDPGCLDYIWVRGPITVESCSLAFDRPALDDPTLYPSDHLGLRARIRVGG